MNPGKDQTPEKFCTAFVRQLFNPDNRSEIIRVWGRFSPHGNRGVGIIPDLSRIFHNIMNVPFEFSVAQDYVSIFRDEPTMRIPLNLMNEKISTCVKIFSPHWKKFFTKRRNLDALSQKFVHLGFLFPNVLNGCINRLEILSDMIAFVLGTLSNLRLSYQETIQIIEGALLNSSPVVPHGGEFYFNFDISKIIGYLKSQEVHDSFLVNGPFVVVGRTDKEGKRKDYHDRTDPHDRRGWEEEEEEGRYSKASVEDPYERVPFLDPISADKKKEEEFVDDDDDGTRGPKEAENYPGRTRNVGRLEMRNPNPHYFDQSPKIWYENRWSEPTQRKRKRNF